MTTVVQSVPDVTEPPLPPVVQVFQHGSTNSTLVEFCSSRPGSHDPIPRAFCASQNMTEPEFLFLAFPLSYLHPVDLRVASVNEELVNDSWRRQATLRSQYVRCRIREELSALLQPPCVGYELASRKGYMRHAQVEVACCEI